MNVAGLTLTNGVQTRVRDTGGSGTPLSRIHGFANSLGICGQVAPGLLSSKHREDVPAGAARLDRPTLLLWDKQDRVFPARDASRAAALLPQARLTLIDRCGHNPHWEQPDIFAAIVLDILA